MRNTQTNRSEVVEIAASTIVSFQETTSGYKAVVSRDANIYIWFGALGSLTQTDIVAKGFPVGANNTMFFDNMLISEMHIVSDGLTNIHFIK